jgi:hypothetical protein
VFAKELLGESERAPSHEALAENANNLLTLPYNSKYNANNLHKNKHEG